MIVVLSLFVYFKDNSKKKICKLSNAQNFVLPFRLELYFLTKQTFQSNRIQLVGFVSNQRTDIKEVLCWFTNISFEFKHNKSHIPKAL